MDDIFSMFGDVFGGHAGGFGGFGGGRPQYRGTDLRLTVRLSLLEISTGVTKKFKVKKDITCSHCHGTGAADASGNTTRTAPASKKAKKSLKSTSLQESQKEWS